MQAFLYACLLIVPIVSVVALCISLLCLRRIANMRGLVLKLSDLVRAKSSDPVTNAVDTFLAGE